ncbi:MAG: hypothetical protein IKV59_10410 [Lachnospiraceae bacterium]|nr:hypothetical protein [Lachnospiraceae bacterium]
MEFRGCEEGKATPKLVEVKCPECADIIEVFVKMGGGVGQTGTLASDEACVSCGYVAKAGSYVSDYEEV